MRRGASRRSITAAGLRSTVAGAGCPGAVVARPVYAPALVAFIGGAGWGVTLAGGAALPAVGWVPLAPREVYHPYYRASVAYVRNVNVTSVNRTVINNITNVTVVNRTTVVNNYANQRGATVVPSAAFTRAAPVHRAALDVPRDSWCMRDVVPTVAHLPPTAAARAGAAIPAAAEMHVPQPNAPANIARTPVRTEPTPSGRAEPSVPASPGPAFAHRPDGNGPRAPPIPAAASGRRAPVGALLRADANGRRRVDRRRASDPRRHRREEARPAPTPKLAGPLVVRPVTPPTPPQSPAPPRAPAVTPPQRQPAPRWRTRCSRRGSRRRRKAGRAGHTAASRAAKPCGATGAAAAAGQGHHPGDGTSPAVDAR